MRHVLIIAGALLTTAAAAQQRPPVQSGAPVPSGVPGQSGGMPGRPYVEGRPGMQASRVSVPRLPKMNMLVLARDDYSQVDSIDGKRRPIVIRAGVPFTIIGSGFDGREARSMVVMYPDPAKNEGKAATILSWSDTRIVAQLPTGTDQLKSDGPHATLTIQCAHKDLNGGNFKFTSEIKLTDVRFVAH